MKQQITVTDFIWGFQILRRSLHRASLDKMELLTLLELMEKQIGLVGSFTEHIFSFFPLFAANPPPAFLWVVRVHLGNRIWFYPSFRPIVIFFLYLISWFHHHLIVLEYSVSVLQPPVQTHRRPAGRASYLFTLLHAGLTRQHIYSHSAYWLSQPHLCTDCIWGPINPIGLIIFS